MYCSLKIQSCPRNFVWMILVRTISDRTLFGDFSYINITVSIWLTFSSGAGSNGTFSFANMSQIYSHEIDFLVDWAAWFIINSLYAFTKASFDIKSGSLSMIRWHLLDKDRSREISKAQQSRIFPPIFNQNKWRQTKTAQEILYESRNLAI